MFADDMIVYVERLKELTTLLELTSDYSKVLDTAYYIDTGYYKSQLLLYTAPVKSRIGN